jgi:lipid-binding SYLF domain-containing protein
MRNLYPKASLLAAPAAILVLLGGCETAPRTESGREALTAQSGGVLGSFKATDSTLNDLLAKSVGYAIFPDVGKAGFIAGGAYGHGEVYEYGRLVGYADLSQGSVGLQIGVQSYDELILFLNQEQLNKFKSNQFAFSANVSAVAIKPGVAAAADHSKGVVVFVQPRGGLMAEASIGGQQFTYQTVDQAMQNRQNTTTTTTTTTERSSSNYR